MILLHASVHQGQLLLWGETPVQADSLSRKRRGRKPAHEAVAHSPFDAGQAALEAALAAHVSGAEAGSALHPFAWLPTSQGTPLASSPLIAEPRDEGAPLEVKAWSVTALQPSTAATVEFLGACVGHETLSPGVLIGHSLAFWATALQFAGVLVAREQFLPGIRIEEEAARACWDPILAGTHAQHHSALARAMPAACRALTPTADAPPDEPAENVLSGFLATMMDYLIREARTPALTHTAPARGRGRKTHSFDSIHEQWLHALRAGDGAMTAPAKELAQLAEQVREWRRPITISVASPFKLCFRLEEPRKEETQAEAAPAATGPWYVRFLLQAANDPSLLVPAADAWGARGQQARLLHRDHFNPREYLLAALGQATAVCPTIEDSLKTTAPAGYEMNAPGAYDFLTQKAWLLEQAGFGVLLPAWWTRKGTKQRLTVRAQVRTPPVSSGGGISLDQLIKFNWQVALGDEVLSLQELETLAKLKVPLVQVRGQWVQMSAEEIQAAIDFWKKKGEGEATVRELVQMALGGAPPAHGLEFGGVDASGWIDEFLSQLNGRSAFEELEPPEGFCGTLRPYQVRGYSWLAFLRKWGLGSCLADDMGLGKTVQTLTLLQRDWEADLGRPTLLICPMSVVGNWQKEAARFTPDLPVLIHHGLTRKKGAAFRKEAARHALVLSSYGLLHRDFEVLKGVDWAGVILDEAQNIKNPETKQAQAARALPGEYRIALTGTPVENHVGDLWSIMEFLNPGFLGTRADFKRSFFYPIQFYHDADAAERLKRLTGPFVLRRVKTDRSIIADLPDKLEMKVYCTLTKEQVSLYAAVVEEAGKAIEKSDGIQRKGVVLATLQKLKQVCNHPAHFLGDNSPIPDRSGKLARLTEMLEEVLAAGDRALIFTQFTEMGELIQRHLQETFGREVLFLHGSVSKKQRDRQVARFQEAGGPPLFLLSLKAGGTGLNLTAANHVFHFDRWWNPAVENQATDRAFRIGQTKNVQVHKFLCVGTLEEKIDDMIERKKAVAGKIVGSGEAWLTELSTAELKDLFALRAEALGE